MVTVAVLLLDDFGRHVAWRAAEAAERVVVLDVAGEPEVRDLDRRVLPSGGCMVVNGLESLQFWRVVWGGGGTACLLESFTPRVGKGVEGDNNKSINQSINNPLY